MTSQMPVNDEGIQESLNRAQAGLTFDDVYQLATNTHFSPENDIPLVYPDNVGVQLRYNLLRSALLRGEEDGSPYDLFFVDVLTGARLVSGEAGVGKNDYLAQIEATYRVVYQVRNSDLLQDNKALDAFAEHNVGMHMWPFWREFAMSQSQRMNIPKVAVPMRRPIPKTVDND